MGTVMSIQFALVIQDMYVIANITQCESFARHVSDAKVFTMVCSMMSTVKQVPVPL